MLDDLRALVVFAHVVEARSFSKAAAQLGITKSAVSKHVQVLEGNLGAQLLTRTTRKLQLTDVGERVYEAAFRIRESAELARDAVSSHIGTVSGTLRVTAPAVLGRKYLVPLVAEFLAQHPALRIELNLSDAFIDLVAERIDVALRIGRVSDPSLVVRRIAEAKAVLCASPAYLRHAEAARRPGRLRVDPPHAAHRGQPRGAAQGAQAGARAGQGPSRLQRRGGRRAGGRERLRRDPGSGV
jgi:DNA-binding transcriptional LysR family regulator